MTKPSPAELISKGTKLEKNPGRPFLITAINGGAVKVTSAENIEVAALNGPKIYCYVHDTIIEVKANSAAFVKTQIFYHTNMKSYILCYVYKVVKNGKASCRTGGNANQRLVNYMANNVKIDVLNSTKEEVEQTHHSLKLRAINYLYTGYYYSSAPSVANVLSGLSYIKSIEEQPTLVVLDPRTLMTNSGKKSTIIPKLLLDEGQLNYIFN